MVEESGHGDALLEACGEHVAPFIFGVPGARAVEDVCYVDCLEPFEEMGVGDVFRAHLYDVVWIDDLLAEGTAGEVGPLRDVED